MHKGWENGARTLWMLNVGDIKPAEIGIDYYARLAWNASSLGPDSQPLFLQDFARRTFGPEHADGIAAFLAEYYRLGQIRKPECMNRDWAAGYTPDEAAALAGQYASLLDGEAALSAALTSEQRDAWTELAGYPARMLAAAGMAFLDDRLARAGIDSVRNERTVALCRLLIDDGTSDYNNTVAGGKWRCMMTAGTFAGPFAFLETIPWPWLAAEPAAQNTPRKQTMDSGDRKAVLPAAAFSRKEDRAEARWVVVDGLGRSGQAMTVEPASAAETTDGSGPPSLEYDFTPEAAGADIAIDLLPTYRLYPGLKLRLAVTLDHGKTHVLEAPGSSGVEDETGKVRRNAVQDNRVTLDIPLRRLSSGTHTLRIQPLDPGLVLDEIEFGPAAGVRP
jgi:hypothetical protein